MTEGERCGSLVCEKVLQLRRSRCGVECVLFGGRERWLVDVEGLGESCV